MERHFRRLDELQAKGKVKTCSSEEEGDVFVHALKSAKASCPTESYWRVDTDYHEAKDYIGKKTYISEGGSTFSVTKDGDIISVCKKATDKNIRGSELLEMAVKVGGKKLDSFDGNFEFYLKNGFEPVSWTAFNDSKEVRPKGWDYNMHQKEPVIFFKYNPKAKITDKMPKSFYDDKLKEFYKTVKMSKDYDTAKEARDALMK